MTEPIARDDELLTITEAAELLKLSEKSVRRYITDSHLIAYQAGPGNIRIRLIDLQNIIRKINN